MNNFKGIIIEESLSNPSVVREVKIVSTKVEPVTTSHKTPWIKQWTMHEVEIEPEKIDHIVEEISKAIDTTHNTWYADFKNETIHYVIYSSKVFKIHREKKEEYGEATKYGISIGIPDYQVDFSEHVTTWKR